jgi:hypothetical protein
MQKGLVVWPLPSKHKALSSNSSIVKRKNKTKIKSKNEARTFFFFLVLGLELRAYTLSHSAITFFVTGFFPDRVS